MKVREQRAPASLPTKVSPKEEWYQAPQMIARANRLSLRPVRMRAPRAREACHSRRAKAFPNRPLARVPTFNGSHHVQD